MKALEEIKNSYAPVTIDITPEENTSNRNKAESGFYKQVKEAASRSNYKLILTRIENWVGSGIPDLLT